MATCKSCGAEIVWATPFGKAKGMPFDAEPSARGDWVLKDGVAFHKGPPAMGTTHVSHFATCPHADWHRKPKPKGQA